MGERNFEGVPDDQLETERIFYECKIVDYGNAIVEMTKKKEEIKKEQKKRLFRR